MDLAEALRLAALPWSPTSGDRFLIPHRGIDEMVFHVSEMTIEVQDHLGQSMVKFNGTTEWALDSVAQDDVLWLPREDQLRTALGDDFVALENDAGRWIVTYRVAGANRRVSDGDAENAYARALLDLLSAGVPATW